MKKSYLSIKRSLVISILILSGAPLANIQTQSRTHQGLISDKYSNIQHQNDWIILQEYNDTASNNYLLRNATYFIPIDQSEVGSNVSLFVESNNWDLFYVKNINLNMVYQVVSPSGTITKQNSFDGGQLSYSFEFQPSSVGIWKVIFFLDFAHMIPQDSTHRAVINADIMVAVANVTAAVSFEVNEYDSTVGYVTQIIPLRSSEPSYSADFYINTTQKDNLIFKMFGTNSINNVTLVNNFTNPFSFDFSKYSDFSNLISKEINFQPINEGIWELDIYFNPYTSYSTLTVQFQDNLFNPITLYLNPPVNSTLFIDNNYDSRNDVNLTSQMQLYAMTNTIYGGNSIFTTTPLPIASIFLGAVVLGLQGLKRRYKQ